MSESSHEPVRRRSCWALMPLFRLFRRFRRPGVSPLFALIELLFLLWRSPLFAAFTSSSFDGWRLCSPPLISIARDSTIDGSLLWLDWNCSGASSKTSSSSRSLSLTASSTASRLMESRAWDARRLNSSSFIATSPRD